MSDLNLKLMYFDAGRGRAEITRWILKQGDIPFTDERISRENWPERKKTTPGGKMPLLMVKEYPLPQSLAIARYAAKKANLIPENDLEAAFVDALHDTIYELMTEFYKIIMSEKSEEDKKKEITEWIPKFVKPIMDQLEKRLKDREWYVSEKMTWGDLGIGLFCGDLKEIDADSLKTYPAIDAHTNKIRALPKIKDWIAKRPVTKF